MLARSQRVALTALLTALGVLFSFYPGPIPLGPTRLFPFQSVINVISGIILGPWYAGGIALAIGMLRIGLHTGSIFAIPGGVPGAILVGIVYRMTRNDLSAFIEIPGTALLGSFLSSLFFAPLIGFHQGWLFFIIGFTPPAVVGSIAGYLIILTLRRRRIIVANMRPEGEEGTDSW